MIAHLYYNTFKLICLAFFAEKLFIIFIYNMICRSIYALILYVGRW